ncbi:MAG TPA: helix-turn-helix domain-containing protein [Ktedonobacteraceae bacterium]|nr:helix-turn-helix domain-containing protein [Ktedonobacteraceae bacterium]
MTTGLTRGEQSRARLLEAATREFARLGYHQTKISTIVADAGVTQPTFYLYFSGKEAIFDELVTAFRQRMRTIVQHDPLAPDMTLPEVATRVQQLIEQGYQLLGENPELTRIALIQAPDAEEIRREYAQLISNNMQIHQAMRFFRSDVPPEIVAESILALIERLALRFVLTGQQDAATLARYTRDLILNGTLIERIELP